MPECLPFCGWLYNPEKVHFEDVLAPPYDVVSESERNFYKQKSLYNIFHLELPESPEKAKNLLHQFIEEKILIKNSIPTLYYYEISFSFENKNYQRGGFILLTKLHPFEEGVILPHEKIYPKVTEERLNLLKTTRCQFSQIFALYEDPDLETYKDLPKNLIYYFEVTHNGETHRLAKIQEKEIIKKILNFLKDKKFYIADGHHRYTTALQFKAFVENHPEKLSQIRHNYVSMYITPFEDKGLLMLPTHRVYQNKYYSLLCEHISNYCHLISEMPLSQWLEKKGCLNLPTPAFILYKADNLKIYAFKETFKNSIGDEDFSQLPLYYFLKLLEKTLNLSEEVLKERGEVKFFGREMEAIEEANKGGFAILFPKSPVELLKKIASKGKTMPHKATYFYPKILTGAVLYRLDDES